MNVLDRLRDATNGQLARLRASVPADRQAALLALLAEIDRRGEPEARADLVSGRRLANPGGNRALQLCLTAEAGGPAGALPHGWAGRFLAACDELAAAELVLGHVETGFIRLADASDGTFDAWIATKRVPASWRERADVDWWAAQLASAPVGPDAGSFQRRADGYLQRFGYQLGYPSAAAIDGITVGQYRAVLARLIALALEEREQAGGAGPRPRSERALVAELARGLRTEPGIVARAVAAFTLDAGNATWHGAVPGVAAAPLVRVADDAVALSLHGLTSEPLFFLTRELRRRSAQEYSNSGHYREARFREDLYALFADKRFVTGGARVQLRRETGTLRTDIDAVVFDRRTGTLGLFELKSQDPFARSTAELIRQRDNLLYANRQVAGVLAWVQREGAQEILTRVDSRVAKTFRAHKVYPFVLGRYLAHFPDGAEPDRRAAWGTWPQLLRLLGGGPVRADEANPIAALHARLTKDAPDLLPPAGTPPRELDLGATRLTVHPSTAAYQERTGR